MDTDYELEAARRRLASAQPKDSPPGRISSTKPAFCGMCNRNAIALPIAANPRPGKLFVWVCKDPNCWHKAVEGSKMTNEMWMNIEKRAAAAAMQAGQAPQLFCKSAGVTDFKVMTPEQRRDFALAVLESYRAAIVAETFDSIPF